jgi:hypothetical protein
MPRSASARSHSRIGVAGGGLGFWLEGKSQMDRFETLFGEECKMGCDADLNEKTDLRDLRGAAQTNGKIGVTMMVTGDVFAVAGAVWAIINRPQRVMPKMEVSPVEGGATASAGWHF